MTGTGGDTPPTGPGLIPVAKLRLVILPQQVLHKWPHLILILPQWRTSGSRTNIYNQRHR
jgi:hypothetical protein